MVRRALLLLFLCPVLAAAGEGPRLHIEQKELDFGELLQGNGRDLAVRVENKGDEPLLLRKAEASCGCTLTKLPTDPIGPGAAAEIGLRFESRGRLGRQHVQVLIYSNDPTQNDQGRSCTLVMLKGDVRSLFRVAPAGAFFGELARGNDPGARDISVTGIGPAKQGFKLEVASELPDWVQVEVTKGDSPEKLGLKVRLLPSVPTGEVHTIIELKTGIAEQPMIELPVVAIVTGGVVAPEYVHLLRNPRGERVERRVPLERRDGKAGGIAIRGLEFDQRWLDVQQEPISPQRLDLLLALRATAPPGPFATELVVLLDDPELPRITIPIFGVVERLARVEPPELLFPASADAEVLRQVVLRGGRVDEASLPEGSPLQVKVLPPERGRQVIEVRLPAGKTLEGGRLVLRTTVEGEERVGIPITVVR